MVLEGRPIYDGMDLGIPYPGYDNITRRGQGPLTARAGLHGDR